MSRWQKFTRLSWAERLFFFKAVIMLGFVQLGLRLVGYQRLVSWIGKRAQIAEDAELSMEEPVALALRENAHRVHGLISTAANHGFYRANCLRRAITAWWVLRQMGLDPRICFGAKKNDGNLDAHAWVELDGEPLGEQDKILETYTVFQEKHED